MKQHLKRTAAVLVTILLAYVLLTPTGSIRASMVLSGHPVSAVTAQLRRSEAGDVHRRSLTNPSGSVLYGQTIYTVSNDPPHEDLTDTDLKNWVSYHFLCLHVGKYYGYL